MRLQYLLRLLFGLQVFWKELILKKAPASLRSLSTNRLPFISSLFISLVHNKKRDSELTPSKQKEANTLPL